MVISEDVLVDRTLLRGLNPPPPLTLIELVLTLISLSHC